MVPSIPTPKPSRLILAAVFVGSLCACDDGPLEVGSRPTCESEFAESDAVSGATTLTATGTLTANIDGAPWSATEDICISFSGTGGQEVLTFFGYANRVPGTDFAGADGLSIGIMPAGVIATGSYVLDEDFELAFSWFTLVGALQWQAWGFTDDLANGASGSVNLSTFTDSRVAGSFAFTGIPNGHSSPNVVVTDGVFDLAY